MFSWLNILYELLSLENEFLKLYADFWNFFIILLKIYNRCAELSMAQLY